MNWKIELTDFVFFAILMTGASIIIELGGLTTWYYWIFGVPLVLIGWNGIKWNARREGKKQ
jgi:type IV secretory pathway TrbD component